MKLYIITFNTEIFKMEAEVLEVYVNKDEIYDKLCSIVQCENIEFIDFNNEIVMVIDEQGKFKKDNPVFRIVTDDGITLDLAGKILFARNIENEFSIDIGSIKAEDIFHLRNNLNIQLLGVTRGE